jgi:hypothetical protein
MSGLRRSTLVTAIASILTFSVLWAVDPNKSALPAIFVAVCLSVATVTRPDRDLIAVWLDSPILFRTAAVGLVALVALQIGASPDAVYGIPMIAALAFLSLALACAASRRIERDRARGK